MDLNIVQYNTFLRPYLISHDGQMERMGVIPDVLSTINSGDIDAIALCEVDYLVDEEVKITATEGEQLTKKMLARFNELGFKFHTPVLNPSPSRGPGQLPAILNGGVIIVSKWPIKKVEQLGYNSCNGDDCAAAKGVMYAACEKTDGSKTMTFHLFATHMQAWYTPNAEAARKAQAVALNHFIEEMNIPKTDPVIIAGDLNADRVHFPDEYQTIIDVLEASCPKLIGEQRFTSDPSSNLLVGRDGASDGCNSSYENSWTPKTKKDTKRTSNPQSWGTYYNYNPNPANKNPSNDHATVTDPFFTNREGGTTVYLAPGGSYCGCCPHEWLDYVLFSNKYLQPSTPPTLECIPIKSDISLNVPWTGKLQPWALPKYGDSILLTDLSDHYPVIGRFKF
jgi:endonuclease/exonuclease/phosphatase family metal-dependent hydrolase